MTTKLAYVDDRFHDECGVFGVFGHPEAANLTYLGLYALQHRGQESAGIVSSTGHDLYMHKAMGEVEEIFQPRVLSKLPGSSAIGHTRYSTAGDKALLNVQPIMIDCNKGKMAVAHNGNLTNATEWRRKLEHRGSIFQTNSDTEVIVHLVARSQARNLSAALGDALNQVEGAYSLVVLTADELYAVRDPRGFRPLALGKIEGHDGEITWMVASETCAFDLLNAHYVRDIEPGEMLRISRAGLESIHFSPPKPHQYCIFEHVYFSRPDSIVFGRAVNESREMLGRLLAREHPVDADMVVPIPDSGVPAAIGFALESKIPFRMGLIRNHYIGRTFIEPSQAIRNFGVKLKLNPVRSLIAGKRVVLIDDSIVRGTTSRKLVRMVREAGATEVHMRISCPPTISPCYYGVDTPTKEELIASSNTPEEIRKYLGADSLGYLSLQGLRQAVNDTEGKFCTSCYTGVYPTDLVQLEVRENGAAKSKEEVTVERER
ncbi:MAG TPA: amidophosphoribosyltransferase [Candidatus Acidoferrum sp.]|jgi:amidophosphoribosyltransferase